MVVCGTAATCGELPTCGVFALAAACATLLQSQHSFAPTVVRVIQLGFEGVERRRDPSSCGKAAHAEDARHLHHAQPLVVTQLKHLALIGGKRLKRFAHFASRLGGRRWNRFVELIPHAPAPAACVDADAPRDGEQIRKRLSLIAVRWHAFHKAKERLLGCIRSLVGRGRVASAVRQNVIVVCFDYASRAFFVQPFADEAQTTPPFMLPRISAAAHHTAARLHRAKRRDPARLRSCLVPKRDIWCDPLSHFSFVTFFRPHSI